MCRNVFYFDNRNADRGRKGKKSRAEKKKKCHPELNYAKFISLEEAAISTGASPANWLLFRDATSAPESRTTPRVSDDFRVRFETRHFTTLHLPSWSKRGIIAVKSSPCDSDGKAGSVLGAIFEVAAALAFVRESEFVLPRQS